MPVDEPIASSRERRAEGRRVAVGMAVTHHPPHRSVLALLTHTVLTSDEGPDGWVFERETNLRVRVQSLDFRKLISELLHELVPCPAGSLTPPSKLPPPHAQHFVSKRLHSLLVARDRMILEVSTNHRPEPFRRIIR